MAKHTPAEPTPEEIPQLESEIGTDALVAANEALAKTKEELTATKNNLLRTAAEYENFRKRSAKERDAAFNNGVGFSLTNLLPLIDTLEIAAEAPTKDEEYKKGVLLTLAKCEEAFKLLGVSEIEALGQMFDPALHAAVLQSEHGEPGTITRVLQKGYKAGSKVIRHASVAVAIEE